MFPRNLIVYHFDAELRSDIEAALQQHPVRDPGPADFGASGFTSPYGRTDERRVVRHGDVYGFAHEERVRDISTRAVMDEVARRIEMIAEDESRKVRGRERRRIADDVWNEVLPRALVVTRVTRGWIDLANGRVVLDVRSRKTAENVLSALREAFGTLPAVQPAPEESPRVHMTSWLSEGAVPEGLTLGDECELRDPSGAHGSVVRCRRQDLDTEEIREHLRSGKQCFSTGLTFDDRLDLVLGEDLAIRALRPTDVLLDSTADNSYDSQDEEIEGSFALAVLEVNRLLEFLERTFNVTRPEGV
jgi:recombination associated protein RdgC